MALMTSKKKKKRRHQRLGRKLSLKEKTPLSESQHIEPKPEAQQGQKPVSPKVLRCVYGFFFFFLDTTKERLKSGSILNDICFYQK